MYEASGLVKSKPDSTGAQLSKQVVGGVKVVVSMTGQLSKQAMLIVNTEAEKQQLNSTFSGYMVDVHEEIRGIARTKHDVRRLSRLSPAYAKLKEQSSGPGCMLLYDVCTNYRLLRSIRGNRRYLVVGYETISPERVIW